MSGISIATIIMEAGEKSGALRQADHCIKQGRDILIPYSLLYSSLLWPRKYIQKGAHTFKNIKDVLEFLNKNDILYLLHNDDFEVNRLKGEYLCVLK